jgi:heme-degrading monooxygenase HmoA
VIQSKADPTADAAIVQWDVIAAPLLRATAAGFEKATMMRSDDGNEFILVVVFDSKENAALWSSIQNDPEEIVGVYAILSDT